jgi:hypothetical protein
LEPTDSEGQFGLLDPILRRLAVAACQLIVAYMDKFGSGSRTTAKLSRQIRMHSSTTANLLTWLQREEDLICQIEMSNSARA